MITKNFGEIAKNRYCISNEKKVFFKRSVICWSIIFLEWLIMLRIAKFILP